MESYSELNYEVKQITFTFYLNHTWRSAWRDETEETDQIGVYFSIPVRNDGSLN